MSTAERRLAPFVGAGSSPARAAQTIIAPSGVPPLAGVKPPSAPSYEQLDLGPAWVAHELRAPLVGAVAALDRALDQRSDVDASDDAATPWIERARRELVGLSESLHDLLACALGGPIRLRPIDMAAVALSVVDSHAPTGQVGRLRAVIPHQQVVSADPVLLRSAISNLIRNALLYAPAPTEVVVTVERAASCARVSVRDHGPGVPPEERSRIFEPFVRGRTGRATAPGSGLGLFVARRVAETHGGRLSLDSGADGSTFGLEIPLAREVVPSAS